MYTSSLLLLVYIPPRKNKKKTFSWKVSWKLLRKNGKVAMEEQQHADEESIIAQFYSTEGVSTGPQLDIPLQTSVEQLHALVNELLGNVRKKTNHNPMPFPSFFIHRQLERGVAVFLLRSRR